MIPIVDSVLKLFTEWNRRKAEEADAGNVSAKIHSREYKITKEVILQSRRYIRATDEMIEWVDSVITDEQKKKFRHFKERLRSMKDRIDDLVDRE